MSKPKLALYWAASCGGCEVAVLDVAEKILDVAGFFDIVFWPCAMDFKYKDVEAMADGCHRPLPVQRRHPEQRKRSDGAPAAPESESPGSVRLLRHGRMHPGLGQPDHARGDFRERRINKLPPPLNPEGTRPLPLVAAPEGELDIPKFYESVRTLAQVVPVEYFIPGLPAPALPDPHCDVCDHAGSGTAARRVCDRGRREDLLRGMRPSPERKTSQTLLPGLGD